MFRDIWPSNKENPSVYWHATLSCPFNESWPQMMQIRISFRSRSDLGLDADHGFLSDLAFQACISFYSVLDKVAPECFCLLRLKMPLLISGMFPLPEFSTPLCHFLHYLRKLEKAVAVSGVFAGILEESCGKIPGNCWKT